MPSRPRLPPRYRNPQLIAHGGMADVYRADDTALSRTVAVKVLAERYAADDEFRARFTREAQTAARLSGEPNIVVVYDVGTADGRPFIVMEHVPGGSLADRLAAGRVPVGQALAWLAQAARALDAAHARGVVHRDVKPANLLVGADGEVRVGDFGIARAAGHDTLTGVGTILGTSGYMAPEQARGLRATAASDRYALGCVAFELLTGARPFRAETPAVEAAAHASAPIPSASDADPELPWALDAVFLRALAKDPAARHGSCAELVASLREAFHAAAGETARIAAPAPAAGAPAREASVPERTRVARAPRRRGAWAALGAAAVVVAAAGVAVAWMSGPTTLAPEGTTAARTQVAAAPPPETTTDTTEPRPEDKGATERAQEPTPEPSERAPEPEQTGDPGAELNDRGFALLARGDAASALPLLERSLQSLRGSGRIVEAWASYNLALARFALGRCDGVVELLDRSEAVQGERKPIDRLRKQAERRCGGHGRRAHKDRGRGEDA